MMNLSEYVETHWLRCSPDHIKVMVRDGRMYTRVYKSDRIIDIGPAYDPPNGLPSILSPLEDK